jgi:hypothetical protein
MPIIQFPFTRGHWYTIAEFMRFEHTVRDARRQDSELCLGRGPRTLDETA